MNNFHNNIDSLCSADIDKIDSQTNHDLKILHVENFQNWCYDEFWNVDYEIDWWRLEWFFDDQHQ